MPYQSSEQFRYQIDESYQVHHGQYPGRRLPGTSSSKSTKSYSEKSIKSPKSSSKGKGKGIWYHPTPAPSKSECLETPAPAPLHPAGGRNSGPTPVSNPRPSFTGIQYFAPTPFHYKPPTSSPTILSPGDTNDPQDTPGSEDTIEDSDDDDDDDTNVGGFSDIEEDDGGGSSGLNGAQIAFIIVLGVGLGGFIIGGVAYFIFANNQDDDEDDEDSQYSSLQGEFRQQERTSLNDNLSPRRFQEQDELRNAPFPTPNNIARQQTHTSLSHITDPWSHSTGSRRGELGPILSRGSVESSGSVRSTFRDE